MVLAFRDWVTWQAFFNSDSRKSSSARAEGRQGESEAGSAEVPPHAPQPRQPPRRIQMMTGTAAATFPISSSVCMIFLIRACRRKEAELGRRGPRPCRRAGGSRGVSREKGAGGAEPLGHGRGRGVRPRTPKGTRPPTGRTWARASREPDPLRPSSATCSPAETARCTSSSCLASRGLCRRAGPSAAAARSLPAPGLFAAGPPRFPRVLLPPAPPPPLPAGS